ncbi:F-box/FBD/LRR-repeat-like protein [Cinnamomum micranthum f. kanehirae]|uniref:F-box/FBD/LRR-repeat-like protein n=1 Tax=Cinnamomum micranthum f. kanehirae TaxID=337451 RepID=A0A443NPA1_9MAGN|nr:F-box/FBD/LRR-repeat-like protein [Cinnamomum micranthum f. kanehirae]
MLSCSHIDRWIAYLSRNEIKKLMLKVYKDYYDVSSSIFNCQELCHLELFNCRLKVPPAFKGFHNLSVLNLEDIDISSNIIAYLISKSPRLERLTLKAFDFDRLDINAPYLRYLDLDGRFHTLSLGSCPLLTIVSIHFSLPPDHDHNLEQGETCNSIQFFDCSHRIERLVLKGYFIQFSSVGSLPEKLYATYDHLKYLYVDINLYWKEILATLCIMRSSHNLKELKIKCFYYGEEDDLSGQDAVFWVAQTQFDCLFCHLQAVEIIGICGMLLDLEFIRYILASAPVLETMKIYINNDVRAEEVSRILKELLRFRRASPQAEIIYLGHYKES